MGILTTLVLANPEDATRLGESEFWEGGFYYMHTPNVDVAGLGSLMSVLKNDGTTEIDAISRYVMRCWISSPPPI
jgi:hypothetical protein